MFTDGGPFDSSLRGVIEGDEFVEPVTYYPLVSDTDGSGSERPEFGDPQELSLKVSSPSSDDLEIAPTGPDDDVSFVLTNMQDHGLDEGGRVWYDSGRVFAPYRLTAPRDVRFHGDEFAKWMLVEDTRGDGANGTGLNPREQSSGSSDGDTTDDTGSETGGTDDGSGSGGDLDYW